MCVWVLVFESDCIVVFVCVCVCVREREIERNVRFLGEKRILSHSLYRDRCEANLSSQVWNSLRDCYNPCWLSFPLSAISLSNKKKYFSLVNTNCCLVFTNDWIWCTLFPFPRSRLLLNWNFLLLILIAISESNVTFKLKQDL